MQSPLRHVARVATALVGLTAGASAASADTLGLVTLDVAETPIQSSELASAIRLAMGGLGHEVLGEPVSAARARAGSGAVLAERLAPFARAEKLIRDGWSRYVRFELPQATVELEAARQAALEVADLDLGVELVAETSLRLGVIKHENGDAEGSARDFRLAYRLAPSRAVTDQEFKPAVVAAFAAAVAQPTVRRSVTVNATPADAAIEVDGIKIVATNGTLDLEVGLHLVVVRAPTMSASRELVEVPSGGAARIGATLAADPEVAGLHRGELVTGTSAETARAILSATLVFGEIDRVVLVAAVWRGNQPALLGQVCGGPTIKCSAVIEVRFDDASGLPAAAAELARRIDTAPRPSDVQLPADKRLPESKKPIIIEPPPKKKWWQKRWVWIAAGAAAVGTAAGTGLLIWSLQGDTRTVIGVDPCQFGAC